jgi:hypothetical protein
MSPYLPRTLTARLRGIFGPSPIAVWGSRPGSKNRSNFELMSPGDDILIVEGEHIRLIGKVAAKINSAALAHELWKPIGKDGGETWELVYFIANPQQVSVPFAEFGRLFGYSPDYQLRGFTTISSHRVEKFNEEYDDLYSILLRLERGVPVERKQQALLGAEPEEQVPLDPDLVDQVADDETVSDHIRMQWKLARLGLKAGEHVWVPVGDQQKLRRAYQFEEFDQEFAAGIDLPPSYVENIDVVWRREFRIGAAYEIENSTSIYSGLLRFADLNTIAPNTLYPMFLVAPESRRSRVGKQLMRPAFRRLGLDQKVHFLSYDRIDEIDHFYRDTDSGLTVETILAKSELLT